MCYNSARLTSIVNKVQPMKIMSDDDSLPYVERCSLYSCSSRASLYDQEHDVFDSECNISKTELHQEPVRLSSAELRMWVKTVISFMNMCILYMVTCTSYQRLNLYERMLNKNFFRRTRSLNAPSPIQQFGPCGRIMKNSAMVM